MQQHPFWQHLMKIHRSLRFAAADINKKQSTNIQLQDIYLQGASYAKQYLELTRQHWEEKLEVFDLFIILTFPAYLKEELNVELQRDDLQYDAHLQFSLRSSGGRIKYIIAAASEHCHEVCRVIERFIKQHQENKSIKLEYGFHLPNSVDEIYIPSNKTQLKQIFASNQPEPYQNFSWRVIEKVYGKLSHFKYYSQLSHAITAQMCNMLLSHPNFHPQAARTQLVNSMSKVIFYQSRLHSIQ